MPDPGADVERLPRQPVTFAELSEPHAQGRIRPTRLEFLGSVKNVPCPVEMSPVLHLGSAKEGKPEAQKRDRVG